MTSTNNSTRVAKRNSFAKKIAGSFQVKCPELNCTITVNKKRLSNITPEDSILFPEMNDIDIIIYNILVNGTDYVWAENISIFDIQTVIDICRDVHEIDVYVFYQSFGGNVPEVQFVGPEIN